MACDLALRLMGRSLPSFAGWSGYPSIAALQKQPSFNHLVGASDNRCRNTQSKCGSCLEVQGKFEGDRLLDRKLCWFGSLKYPGGVLRRLSTHQSEACPIAREAT